MCFPTDASTCAAAPRGRIGGSFEKDGEAVEVDAMGSMIFDDEDLMIRGRRGPRSDVFV
jgi:hypothetical protein